MSRDCKRTSQQQHLHHIRKARKKRKKARQVQVQFADGFLYVGEVEERNTTTHTEEGRRQHHHKEAGGKRARPQGERGRSSTTQRMRERHQNEKHVLFVCFCFVLFLLCICFDVRVCFFQCSLFFCVLGQVISDTFKLLTFKTYNLHYSSIIIILSMKIITRKMVVRKALMIMFSKKKLKIVCVCVFCFVVCLFFWCVRLCVLLFQYFSVFYLLWENVLFLVVSYNLQIRRCRIKVIRSSVVRYNF